MNGIYIHNVECKRFIMQDKYIRNKQFYNTKELSEMAKIPKSDQSQNTSKNYKSEK
jgi:hypothetical protein